MSSQKDIALQLLDYSASLNIDGLLDAIIALYNDCNYPVLKRIKNIDTFLRRNQESITHLENSRLKGSDFDLVKVIGRGAFGEVRLVRHSESRKVYAMKILDKSEMLRRADTAFFWEERDIMARAESEWIVKLHYAFQDKNLLYMVMEFMPGGDVVNLMANFDINEEWARFYAAELVLALEAIHSMGYIHRDVKPDNMLVSSTGHIKLADFGTCVKMGPDGIVRCSSAVGTPDYISPEMLQQQGTEGIYGRELDWWSVGIFIYELIVGETPFYADSIANTYARIMNYSTTLCFPDDVQMSDLSKDLIKSFLSDAKIRLGRDNVQKVKDHPFFKNDKWNFENIRQATPPYIPTLNGDDDTSHFEDVDEKEPNIAEAFLIPKAFTGNQLPFVGFTYSNELGPIAAVKNAQVTTSDASPLPVEPVINVQNDSIANDREAELLRYNDILQHKVNELEEKLKLNNMRATDLVDRLKMEQNMVEAFKTELQTRREADSQPNMIEEVEVLRQKLETTLDILNSEQMARRMADQNCYTLDSENRSLQATLAQSVERYQRDMQSTRTTINHLTARENELCIENETLKTMVRQLEEKLKQKPEPSDPEPRRVTGGSIGSQNDFENFSRAQLIQRIQREIMLKDQAISKLVMIGSAKGIKDDTVLSNKSSASKKKADMKRIREQIEMEMRKEKEDLNKKIAELSATINGMQQDLYEADNCRDNLLSELQELRAFADEQRNLPSDTHSMDLHSHDSFPSHPTIICSGNLSIKQTAGVLGSKRKKFNWEPMYMELTDQKFTFFKSSNAKQPYLVISVELLYFVRKVKEADLRSVNKKDLERIFQIGYEGIKAGKNSSRRGSMVDLNTSFSASGDSFRNLSTSNSALNYAGNFDDISINGGSVGRAHGKKTHQFLEVSYHMPTNCDFCKRQLASIFSQKVVLECKNCHQKYHKEHVEKNEVPPCNSYETASDLFIMAESREHANIWFNKLSKLIDMRSMVRRANSTVNPRTA